MAKSVKKITGKADAETASVPLHNIRRTSGKDISELPAVKKAKPVTAKKVRK